MSTQIKNVQERYNLPSEVLFCKKCVISNQRPRISFDEQSICSACRFAEWKTQIDWKKREEELVKLLEKHRKNDGSFDVLVPASGGKDSSMVAHRLKNDYGMHPLIVTFSPNIYTEIGRSNMDRFIKSGFNNILFTPDPVVNRKFVHLAFEEMGDPFQAFIYGVYSFPLQIAVKYNISLIMYGENGEVEYGGDPKNADKPSRNVTDDLVKHYFSGFDQSSWKSRGLTDAGLYPYQVPLLEDMRKIGIECHFWSYYHKWVPQENYYYSAEHTGFEANPDGRSEGTYSKYASLDDRLDGFHYYLSFIKFGIGRATSDAAHEIRDGHITRGEGVALVKKYDGEFPKKYFREFLDYAELSEERFWEIVDSFRPPHLWEKVEGEWRLKYQVS